MKLKSTKINLFLVVLLGQLVILSYGDDSDHPKNHKRCYSKFYGYIEKLPENKLSGVWIISKRTIYVDKNTRIEEDHGKIKLGAYVEVKGDYSSGKFIAKKIETERSKRSNKKNRN